MKGFAPKIPVLPATEDTQRFIAAVQVLADAHGRRAPARVDWLRSVLRMDAPHLSTHLLATLRVDASASRGGSPRRQVEAAMAGRWKFRRDFSRTK
jgi:hypothetical protein